MMFTKRHKNEATAEYPGNVTVVLRYFNPPVRVLRPTEDGEAELVDVSMRMSGEVEMLDGDGDIYGPSAVIDEAQMPGRVKQLMADLGQAIYEEAVAEIDGLKNEVPPKAESRKLPAERDAEAAIEAQRRRRKQLAEIEQKRQRMADRNNQGTE